jgi:hypothetical protein
LTLSDNQNRHSEKLLANLTTQVDHHFATGRRFQTLIAAAPSHPDCRATGNLIVAEMRREPSSEDGIWHCSWQPENRNR